jgi:hypothetical protein|tara:strand:+ start:159 stop:440 length:282 start_codon:yes stop_codon:yes gene_type:complete
MYENIRKITIGSDMKSGMHYVIGTRYKTPSGNFTLSNIIYDERHWVKYGTLKVDLYIIMAESDTERIWKSFQDMPIAFEYNLNNKSTYEHKIT